MLKNIKKYINKETIKTIAKEGAQIGVDTVTETGKSFISGIFYKIIFIMVLGCILITAGCVGTDLIVEAIKN